MVDCFAIFGLTRAASLNEEALRNAYTNASKAAHPDHGGSEDLASKVNAAYETLRAPENRLKHLLELASPDEAKRWRTVPLDDEMMSLFSALGKALEISAKFIERKAGAQSAIAKALLANEEMQHRESLERMGFEIDQRTKEMEQQLPAFDAEIASEKYSSWAKIAAMQAKFSYLARWQTQVRERLLFLM